MGSFPRSTDIAQRTATPDAFARFLTWLDPDPETAAVQYERLRHRISRFFTYRGCADGHTLADEVVDRVVAKLDALEDRYSGQCASYLYGVARNVHHEFLRRQSREDRLRQAAPAAPSAAVEAEERAAAEREHGCLERCLAALNPGERELLSAYYLAERSGRPARRRQLAESAGLSADGLRQRTHRLRERVRRCLALCLGGA